jgi:3-oxoadipate enol-lactonase
LARLFEVITRLGAFLKGVYSMADTVTLHYSEVGQGTPLVLLHGFPLSSAIWHEQQQELSDNFRVITPDLRGHGRSPAPAGVYEMELLARDVLALLDSLLVKKAVIMGHSMGGYVALAAWKLAPERFLALGLIASQAGADTEEARQGRFKMAEKVAADGSKVVAEAMLFKLFSPDLPGGSPIINQVGQMILNTPTAGIIGALKGMAGRADSGPLLPKLNMPVLILAGDKDQIIPLEKTKAMATAVATAALRTIANAGHMPMLEQPQATTTAVRDFLSAVDE